MFDTTANTVTLSFDLHFYKTSCICFWKHAIFYLAYKFVQCSCAMLLCFCYPFNKNHVKN